MATTVTVASKLPMALVLHLEEPWEQKEASPLGHLNVTRHRRLEKTVTIKGCARHFGEANDLSNGCALTHGVDADFWAKWLEAHKDYAPVVNGSLFALQKPQDARAETREVVNERSGFESVDPDNVPEEFRQGATKIAKA